MDFIWKINRFIDSVKNTMQMLRKICKKCIYSICNYFYHYIMRMRGVRFQM